jgi:hypothetical protein
MNRTAIRVGCLVAFLVMAPLYAPLAFDLLVTGWVLGSPEAVSAGSIILGIWLSTLLPALLTFCLYCSPFLPGNGGAPNRNAPK